MEASGECSRRGCHACGVATGFPRATTPPPPKITHVNIPVTPSRTESHAHAHQTRTLRTYAHAHARTPTDTNTNAHARTHIHARVCTPTPTQMATVYAGGCRKGELTLVGQGQALELGRWLRARYVHKYGLLPQRLQVWPRPGPGPGPRTAARHPQPPCSPSRALSVAQVPPRHGLAGPGRRRMRRMCVTHACTHRVATQRCAIRAMARVCATPGFLPRAGPALGQANAAGGGGLAVLRIMAGTHWPTYLPACLPDRPWGARLLHLRKRVHPSEPKLGV